MAVSAIPGLQGMNSEEYRKISDRLQETWPNAFGTIRIQHLWTKVSMLSKNDFDREVSDILLNNRIPPSVDQVVEKCRYLVNEAKRRNKLRLTNRLADCLHCGNSGFRTGQIGNEKEAGRCGECNRHEILGICTEIPMWNEQTFRDRLRAWAESLKYKEKSLNGSELEVSSVGDLPTKDRLSQPVGEERDTTSDSQTSQASFKEDEPFL